LRKLTIYVRCFKKLLLLDIFLVICGPTDINGYALCLGVDSCLRIAQVPADLRSLVCSITYLIRGANFRPEYAGSRQDRPSLDICPLGELVDMYHTHEATKLHDKVYALLGMSSDSLGMGSLSPNYDVPWEDLLLRLAKLLLPKNMCVKTWGNDRKVVVVRSKGRVIGKVTFVSNDITLEGRETMNIQSSFRSTTQNDSSESDLWTLQTSAKPIREGDIICLLQGASAPTIIRTCDDYFAIIMITASPPKHVDLQSRQDFPRDFLLVWDWEEVKSQRSGEYGTLTSTSNLAWGDPRLDTATSTWNSALILGDVAEYGIAQARLQEATQGYESVFERRKKKIQIFPTVFTL
jgi:hypothetical protein